MDHITDHDVVDSDHAADAAGGAHSDVVPDPRQAVEANAVTPPSPPPPPSPPAAVLADAWHDAMAIDADDGAVGIDLIGHEVGDESEGSDSDSSDSSSDLGHEVGDESEGSDSDSSDSSSDLGHDVDDARPLYDWQGSGGDAVTDAIATHLESTLLTVWPAGTVPPVTQVDIHRCIVARRRVLAIEAVWLSGRDDWRDDVTMILDLRRRVNNAWQSQREVEALCVAGVPGLLIRLATTQGVPPRIQSMSMAMLQWVSYRCAVAVFPFLDSLVQRYQCIRGILDEYAYPPPLAVASYDLCCSDLEFK
jgi:hypothetical protein